MGRPQKKQPRFALPKSRVDAAGNEIVADGQEIGRFARREPAARPPPPDDSIPRRCKWYSRSSNSGSSVPTSDAPLPTNSNTS